MSKLPSLLHWFAVRVPPQKEFIAKHLVERCGIDVFLPVDEKWRRANRYAKRKELKQYPVLVGYVLLGFERPAFDWRIVHKVPLIKSVVGFNGAPAQLKNSSVCDLVAIFKNGKLRAPREQRYMHTHREFGAGDDVKIIDGAFIDQEVRVEEIKGHMAKIMLPMFGGKHVEIELEKLEAA